MQQFWKIGELAERTGLTVRTLQYYEEIGLLAPSYRTPANHRLYTPEDIGRLQRVIALKSLGFPLERVKDALEKPEFSPARVIGLQIAHVGKELASQTELLARLKGVERYLETYPEATTEDLLALIALTERVQASLTEEQRAGIHARGEQLGEAGMRQAEADWKRVMDGMREYAAKGTDPADPAVQALAREWKRLVDAFTGGDPAIAAALKEQYEKDPGARRASGMETGVMEYAAQALAVLEGR